MRQTEVFDLVASQFGRPFTKEELYEKLCENREWKKNDSYFKSCIRNRKRRDMITQNGDFYTFIGPVKGNGSFMEDKASLLETFSWTDEQFREAFSGGCDAFLSDPKVSILDKLENARNSKEVNDLFKQAVEKSFDAASMGSFYLLRDTNDPKTKKEQKDKGRDLVIECIKEAKPSIFATNASFDDWHKCVCEKFIECFRDVQTKRGKTGPAWKYANSQKLLNLALKYLVVFTHKLTHPGPYDENDEFIKMGKPFLDNIDKLHMPIDSYIIGALRVWASKHHEVPPLPKDNRRGKEDEYKPWTLWDEEDYTVSYFPMIQSFRSCGISPIKWETKMWPVAKKLKLNTRSVLDYV